MRGLRSVSKGEVVDAKEKDDKCNREGDNRNRERKEGKEIKDILTTARGEIFSPGCDNPRREKRSTM